MVDLSQKINLLEQQRNEYLSEARKDVATKRAMHNAQLNSYNEEIKPLKRKQFFANMQQGFTNFAKSVGKMGPQ